MIGGMENRDEKVKSFAEDRFTRKKERNRKEDDRMRQNREMISCQRP